MTTIGEIRELLVPAGFDPAGLGGVLVAIPSENLTPLLADLRLFSRPVQFRILDSADDARRRALVRVQQLPPLIISRLLDGASRYCSHGPATVFTEHAPGIWVQVGYRLIEGNRVERPEEHIVLLLAPDEIETIADGPFAAESEELAIQKAPVSFRALVTSAIVNANLRLVPAQRLGSPRLWVLRQDALAELTSYCRTTHQQLLTRFLVAVSASAGVPCVVLRDTTGKGPPPVFVGSAIAYEPLLRLRGLYVPVGFKLAPLIRRDAIATALSVHPDRLTWMHPLGDGRFQAESLPESAFGPLSNWIDYRICSQPGSQSPWEQSHRWAFAPFAERSDVTESLEKKSEPVIERAASKRPSEGLLARTLGWLRHLRRERFSSDVAAPEAKERSVRVGEALKTALNQGHRLHLARPETSSSAMERCRTLEARFVRELTELKADVPPESWAELAAAYDAAGNHSDAAMCWLNALWGQADPSPLWAWGWLRSEAKAARPEVRTIDPIPWLAAAPSSATTRAMAAWVVWASLQRPIVSALNDRAAELQSRLHESEQWLPVRAAWLARTATARAGSADVLAIARTRDRLSERLRTAGLSLELDAPTFLRFAGDGMREKFQEARHWLVDKRDTIHQWIARLAPDVGSHASTDQGSAILRSVGLQPNLSLTRAYADLILAWGLTRFAEFNAADAIRKQAVAALPNDNPVHAILSDAFEFRIAQLRESKPAGGPLPADILNRIAQLDGRERYAVEKLREQSRILEPSVCISAHSRVVGPRTDAPSYSMTEAIASMPVDRLNDELARALTGDLPRQRILDVAELICQALDRAWELSEPAITAVFGQLPRAVSAARNEVELLGRLLSRGYAAASHWDRTDIARELTTRLVEGLEKPRFLHLAELVTGDAIRCLRRLGMKGDADRLLHITASRVLQSRPIGRLRVVQAADWPASLRVLLQVAAGWYSTGVDEEAHKILDEARQDLLAKGMSTANRTKLVIAYLAALSRAPIRIRLGRLEEVFQSNLVIKVEGSTNEYYSLNLLRVVEAAVRAVIADDFAIGPQVRAWLDADEMAVRRRIRDELREVLAVHESNLPLT